jgi:hypothetical protein
MVIILVDNGGYSIHGYYINGYWWLLIIIIILVIILFMAIGDYFINGL